MSLTVTGTASSGSDYTTIGTAGWFATGAATATARVSVPDNNMVEPDETIIVALTAGTGYTMGSPRSATVTIKDDESADVEVIVDNADAVGVVKVGAWVASNYGLGHWPTNYLHDGNAQKVTKSVKFQRDSEVWFDYLAQTNAWTPLRYLNVNFWGDEHGAHPPAIREIFWRDR